MSEPVTVRPAQRVREPVQSVAVVGAGMAGLSCAQVLVGAGLDVCVFDKSRGPSGRLSTRRREAGQWDHGAPYFEARTPAFRAQCQAWARDGLVERWEDGHDPERWVGIPRMSAIGRRLVGSLPLKTGIRVASVAQRDEQWWLTDTEAGEHGPFDVVVLAIPAPQAAELLAPFSAVHAAVASVAMHPVHALLVAFEHKTSAASVLRPVEGPFELVVPNWIKPGRPPSATWVAHTRPSWSQARLEEPPGELEAELLGAFRDATGVQAAPVRCMVHRWRFAHASEDGAFEALHWWEPRLRLGITGDWCAGRGVEAAWCSGTTLAERVQGSIGLSPASVTAGPASGEGAAAPLG